MENNQIEVHQTNDISYNRTEISEAEQLGGNVVILIKEIMEISESKQLGRNVVEFIKEMKEQLPPVKRECSIYRVPKLLRRMNHTAYTPQVISIGPFHNRSRKDLIATEQYKLRHCINFLSRLDNEMSSLESLLKSTQIWVKDARNCYAEPINLRDEDFVKMMVVDGCFVVEFLILRYEKRHRNTLPPNRNSVDLSFYQITQDIYADLIKVENQVPFFVLEHLFGLIPQKDGHISFREVTKIALQRRFKYCFSLSEQSLTRQPWHLVDILNSYFIMESSKRNYDFDIKFVPPSITELCEAGVTIKRAEEDKCTMDISFKNAVLEIPPLPVDDDFETMWRNLIAFNNFPVENRSKFMAYVSFMDDLISTEKDVSLLVKAGIIINDIGGSNIEVSRMFNNLCKFVVIRNDGSFNDTSKALCEHCNKRWNKAKASLKHNYFNTPWAIISFLAATLLIVLTLLQTIFSIKSAFPR